MFIKIQVKSQIYILSFVVVLFARGQFQEKKRHHHYYIVAMFAVQFICIYICTYNFHKKENLKFFSSF